MRDDDDWGTFKKSNFYFPRARKLNSVGFVRRFARAHSSDVTFEASFFSIRHCSSQSHVETRQRLARHRAFYDETDDDPAWGLARGRSSARGIGFVFDVSIGITTLEVSFAL